MRCFNLVMVVLLLYTFSNCVFAKETVAIKSCVNADDSSINIIYAQELYNDAYKEYCLAKMSDSNLERANLYAEAIERITRAIAFDEENADYYTLASQIYRGKGGIMYAKGYFNFAESILAREIVKDPNDIGANLDYAILCFAGDVKFWDNYNDYLNVAQKHANRVIELCNNSLKNGKSSSLLRAKAIANLILGNNSIAQQLFSQSRMIDYESGAVVFFRKLIPSNEKLPTTINIILCDLYERHVVTSTWLWPVGENHIVREFLLYYLADLTRNNDL